MITTFEVVQRRKAKGILKESLSKERLLKSQSKCYHIRHRVERVF
jgi:hypothetical protein